MSRQIGLVLATALLCACQPTVGLQPGDPSAWSLGVLAEELPDQPRTLDLTIYQRDLAFVRDVRRLELSAGDPTLRLDGLAPRLDPSSVLLRPLAGSAIEIGVQRVLTPVSSSVAVLERYVGREVLVRLEAGGPLVSAVLVSVGETVVVRHEGQLVVRSPEDVVLPEAPVPVTPHAAVEWQLNAPLAGERVLALSYLTSGMSWQANYTLQLLSDTRARLSARAGVTNDAGIPFPDARLTLVAGEPNRVPPQPGPALDSARTEVGAPVPLGDLQAFPVEGRWTLREHEVTQLPLLAPTEIPVEKRYVFEAFDFHPPTDAPRSARVELSFVNSEANGLGRPLPAGPVRIYDDAPGVPLALLGEDRLGNTPEGERVRLQVSDAFDVVGERARQSVEQLPDGRLERYTVSLRNHRDEPVTVDVVEHPFGDWQVVSASHPHRRESANELVFTVPVPANGEATLSFTLRFQERTPRPVEPSPIPVEPSPIPLPSPERDS